MSDRFEADEVFEELSRAKELAVFHFNEFKSYRAKDYIAAFSVITGGLDVVRGNDDPLTVVKGIGKIAFGVILGSTGKRHY